MRASFSGPLPASTVLISPCRSVRKFPVGNRTERSTSFRLFDLFAGIEALKEAAAGPMADRGFDVSLICHTRTTYW